MTNPSPSPPTDLASALDGLRASVAAECARKGPAGALARAILRFLELLAAVVADFRAGRLAAVAASEEAGAAREPGRAVANGAENPAPGASAVGAREAAGRNGTWRPRRAPRYALAA